MVPYHVRMGERMTLEEIDQYVRLLISLKWFQERWPIDFYPEIKDGRGSQMAKGNKWMLSFPNRLRCKMIVLHELAHFIVERHYGARTKAWHSREFCAVYLELVQHEMGKEVATILRDAFKATGAKYKPKREISPEQMERLQERGRQLAASRRQSCPA